jgi:hypothetical protein
MSKPLDRSYRIENACSLNLLQLQNGGAAVRRIQYAAIPQISVEIRGFAAK